MFICYYLSDLSSKKINIFLPMFKANPLRCLSYCLIMSWKNRDLPQKAVKKGGPIWTALDLKDYLIRL
jgi:hypothetical protein